MEKLTCGQAKKIALADYLAFLGYLPQHIKNNNCWYLSPLRNERTASFKVDRKRNQWFDHGLGKGGDLIDFGTRYFKCSVAEFLGKLDDTKSNFSFHQPVSLSPSAGEKKEESKIIVLETRPLQSVRLLQYLEQRNIPLSLAKSVCTEVIFVLYGRQNTAIGFPNNAGGYELRSEEFKGSSSPKATTFFDNGGT
ncbi:MAG: DNA primase, partial [Bacteroidetes bacterium]|nr:DNA primase [Bacteroidota bacterium]